MCLKPTEISKLKEVFKELEKNKKSAKNLSADQIRETMAIAYRISKEIESFNNILGKEAVDRKLADKMIPEYESKFALKEKFSQSIIDNEKVFGELGKEKYIQVTNVNMTKVKDLFGEDSAEAETVKSWTSPGQSKGEFEAKISKMNKQELKEHGLG